MPNKKRRDLRYLNLARHVSTWSKDTGTHCGAVILRTDNTIASVGYNGFPRGIDDSPSEYKSRHKKINIVLHAEENAILHARENLAGSTIYVYPFSPCASCAAKIIQSHIRRVVTPKPATMVPRWRSSARYALEMFAKTGVTVDFVALADEWRHQVSLDKTGQRVVDTFDLPIGVQIIVEEKRNGSFSDCDRWRYYYKYQNGNIVRIKNKEHIAMIADFHWNYI